jgi:hypothetical protein
MCCMDLIAVDLAGGGAGDDGDGVTVDVQPEAVVAGRDGDDLAGVDDAGLDPLGGDHDLPALRYPALNH